MNPYNLHIHHRRSIRLKGYDYGQAGLYFVTICVQNRECLFGEIDTKMSQHVGADLRVCPDNPNIYPNIHPDAEMKLNEAGTMVEKWYYELENKFSDIRCHEMIVMPNHFHCILENVGSVGADLRVCPDLNNGETNIDKTYIGEHNQNILGEHAGSPLRVCPDLNNGETNIDETYIGKHNQNILGQHAGSPLHLVIQWFKTMSTNEYILGVKTLGWQPFDGKLWQRNYYEHIIRNERSYQAISEYIINNPAKWLGDRLYRQ